MGRLVPACGALAAMTLILALLQVGNTTVHNVAPRLPEAESPLASPAFSECARSAISQSSSTEPTAAAPPEEPESAEAPVSYVYGAVLGPNGMPVRDVHVRFSSLGAGAAWFEPHEFDCNEVGSYAGEIPPGTWMASVVLGVSISAPQRDDALSASNHPLRVLVQPLPRIDTLAARTSTEFSFQFGAGPCDSSGYESHP